MRLLHTSDWHIGHAPGRNRRHDEHAALLDRLARVIEDEAVDVLLVAGDVFDSGSPTNASQELYYSFLRRVAAGRCRHAVVVAGNHDSPAFLNAPRELLRALNIHVVGCAETNPADEVLLLRDPTGMPELLVCAVPHLRDRDVRESAEGESAEDKDRNLVEAVRAHYAAVLAAAEEKMAAAGVRVPIIATGHLFAAGGSGGGAVADDGVRDLYVGSLAHIPADVFPPAFAYVALGHLHAPQIVAGDPTRRYSGAPLAMGFGEAGREKSVVLVDIDAGGEVRTRSLPVPAFRRLERITGDWGKISGRLSELVSGADHDVWLDIEYTGEGLLPDLHSRVSGIVADSGLLVVRTANRGLARVALTRNSAEETLDDLSPGEVFERCLAEHEIAETDRDGLRELYREILHAVQTADTNAE